MNKVMDCVMSSVNDRPRDICRYGFYINEKKTILQSVIRSKGNTIYHSIRYDIENITETSVRRSFRGSVIADVVDENGRFVRNPLQTIRNTIENALGNSFFTGWDTIRSNEYEVYPIYKTLPRVPGSIVNKDSARFFIKRSTWHSTRESSYGQHDSDCLMAFDYLRSACGLVRETDPVRGHLEQAQAAGWYIPDRYRCWVSERHNILRLNKQNRLHCDTGPALVYPDGWSIYALNGVTMKAEDILTPAEKIDPKTILTEINVDVRRELLRKVGLQRVITYGVEVDRQGTYELIDMSPIFRGNGIDYAPYLLMKNASIEGAQHFEGVSPECRTVEQAINWRASEVAKTWTPDLLS
jgi:hypothetical protein